MAQIPMGNFGYAQAAVKGSSEVSTRVEDNSSLKIANVIGDAVQGITKDFKDSIDLQAKISANTKRNKASVNANEFETKLQAAELDLERQHAEGDIGSDALLPAWEDTAKKLKEEITPFANELDDETRAEYMQRLESVRVNGLARFQGSALNAVKKDHQSSVLEAYDTFRKANLGNAAAADAWLDGEGGQQIHQAFGSDAVSKIREYKAQASLDSVTMAITKAGDDVGALSQVYKQLQGDEAISRLDPDKRMAISANLQGRMDSLTERAAAKAERESYKRETTAQRSVVNAMEFMTQGNNMSADGMIELAESTKGTSAEGTAQHLLMYQDKIQSILNAPESQRTMYLEEQRRNLAENGSTPEQLAQFKMLENAAKQRSEMEKSDPHLAYEIKSGSDRITIDPDSDTMNVVLAEREARAKAAGTSELLRPSERTEIAGRITKGSPDQRLAEIEKITSKTDPQTAIKIMGESGAEKEAAYSAYAGMLLARGKKPEALAILKGDEIIKTGAEGYISKSTFAENLPKEFNEAFKHDEVARKNAIESAYRGYLAGVTPGEEAKNNIIDDARASVETYIGKTAKVGRGNVLLPDGYDEDKFNETLGRSFVNAKQTRGLQGDIDDYQYRPIVDSTTGKMVYRVDVDGKPMGDVPIYLSVD